MTRWCINGGRTYVSYVPISNVLRWSLRDLPLSMTSSISKRCYTTGHISLVQLAIMAVETREYDWSLTTRSDAPTHGPAGGYSSGAVPSITLSLDRTPGLSSWH